MEYYFENNKELNKFSMVFDITSFLWLEEQELMHEREKIIHLKDETMFLIFILLHISLEQKNDCFWKSLVLEVVIQLVRMTNVITEKTTFQEKCSHWEENGVRFLTQLLHTQMLVQGYFKLKEKCKSPDTVGILMTTWPPALFCAAPV